MSFRQVDGFDYMEGQEVVDFVDEMNEDNYVRGDADVGGDDGDAGVNDYDMLTKVTDTSSAQVRGVKDIQGIPWERLNITRENYRLTRLEQYKSYENIPASGQVIDKECKQVEKGGCYFDFFSQYKIGQAYNPQFPGFFTVAIAIVDMENDTI